jgi:hypothetical protein
LTHHGCLTRGLSSGCEKSLIRERASEVNRVRKVLEGANIMVTASARVMVSFGRMRPFEPAMIPSRTQAAT